MYDQEHIEGCKKLWDAGVTKDIASSDHYSFNVDVNTNIILTHDK